MLGQALMVGLVGAIGTFDFQLGTLYAHRPIVLCPLVGLVLGDLQAGLMIGASLELLFMGNISIGAYVPPDSTVGSVLATAFAISLSQGTEGAIALAMPIATLSLALGNLESALAPLFLEYADKSAAAGKIRGVKQIHWLIGLLGTTRRFLLCFLAFYYGVDAVQGILDWIPEFVMEGFGVAANILPVMGFAMLGRMILNKKLIPFFFAGFLITSYTGVPVLGVALISIIIALDKTGLLGGNQLAYVEGDDDDDF